MIDRACIECHRKTDYNILDGDVEVPIKIRHDEKTNLTKIQIDDQEQIIRGYVKRLFRNFFYLSPISN